MEKVILIGLIVMLFVALIYVLQTRSINKKSEDSKPKETPFTRADKQRWYMERRYDNRKARLAIIHILFHHKI